MAELTRRCYLLGYKGRTSPLCYGLDTYFTCSTEEERRACLRAIALYHLEEPQWEVHPAWLSFLMDCMEQFFQQYHRGQQDAAQQLPPSFRWVED